MGKLLFDMVFDFVNEHLKVGLFNISESKIALQKQLTKWL